MKRTPLLHSELSGLIAAMGHGDLLVIGDAGLPVPPGVRCIDLAVTRGVPRFFDVLDAVLAEPDGTVREVVYPAVDGGEATLRELLHEFRTNGPTYRRTVAIT